MLLMRKFWDAILMFKAKLIAWRNFIVKKKNANSKMLSVTGIKNFFYSCSFNHSCFEVAMTGYYDFVGGMILRIL